MGMTGYKIGNILRGYICFSAGSDREAWDKGRAMSDEACPTNHGTEPAQVELYALRPVPATPKCVEQDPFPEAWCPILIGYSDEPYPGAAS